MRIREALGGLVVTMMFATGGARGAAQTSTSTPFEPLNRWKNAIVSGDENSLRALYSVNPAAKITASNGEIGADEDVAFWKNLKVRRLKVDVVESDSSKPGLQQLLLQLEFWQQQGEQWRIVAVQRTDAARLQQPISTNKELYPTNVDGAEEIKQALGRATKAHRRVLVVFGANWCFDCHVLDLAFHRADLAPLIAKNYEVVHVDIGKGEKNQDLMEKYQVPMKKGIPGVAVLESSGKLLYSQKNGEFEKARSLGPEDLLAFLNKWKPQAN
jgi:thioredoxin 1